ncbi:hypothetical protein CEXT_141901 [Caerostris extrusa]|uniref:Uncharacterized protein n=1 Tax=Caerostris extrusa TaxID=172846 RepID=A0AAV4QQR2_CAEEX|nr:hypothetical protein CEXT_141901 [Caerostris extrusa]
MELRLESLKESRSLCVDHRRPWTGMAVPTRVSAFFPDRDAHVGRSIAATNLIKSQLSLHQKLTAAAAAYLATEYGEQEPL